MRRQLPQKILFLNRDKGIRENRIPFSEFYSSISSAMTVRIATTTGIHFPRLISFPSYLAMKRDKRHWRAVPQSHSTCFPRHGGILVKSPNRHSQQVSAMRSQGPFEQSEQCRSKLWKRLNDAAGMRQQVAMFEHMMPSP